MAQTISRRPLTTEAQVLALGQVSSLLFFLKENKVGLWYRLRVCVSVPTFKLLYEIY
jgi:hypothetical protein